MKTRISLTTLALVLALAAAACGTHNNATEVDDEYGESPSDVDQRYIIFLNPDRFPSFTHANPDRQATDRLELARAAEAYEEQMALKIRDYAQDELGLAPSQIVNIMAVAFSAIVAELSEEQAAAVEDWPERFPDVMMVQRDYEVTLDPDPVIPVDLDTLGPGVGGPGIDPVEVAIPVDLDTLRQN